MNIYECHAIIQKVDELALKQDGELTEEQIQEITEAHTKSIESREKLWGYMKYLEAGIKTCKEEVARINKMKKTAENRLENIKTYLVPYVRENGKVQVKTGGFSIRKSKSVEVDEWFEDKEYMNIKVTATPDKKKLKEALAKGVKINGARIVEKENLQVK